MFVLLRISICYYNENVTPDLVLLKTEGMIEYAFSIKINRSLESKILRLLKNPSRIIDQWKNSNINWLPLLIRFVYILQTISWFLLICDSPL